MNQICMIISIIFITSTFGEVPQPVVDWFGDPRGGKPQDNFYDLIYDENGKYCFEHYPPTVRVTIDHYKTFVAF